MFICFRDGMFFVLLILFCCFVFSVVGTNDMVDFGNSEDL
jgi:hypothetical protein